jgi:hypothetical protein
MSQNLITAGIIDPAQLPLDQVRLEVATLLKISPDRIEGLECWPHQIWVKIVDARAKFVSYRRLPLWIEQGLAAIGRCSDRFSLDQLGEMFRTETQQYEDHYEPEDVQQWRNAWAQQAQRLREAEARRAAEEERLRPIRAHQQAGKEWQESWRQVLRYCRDCSSLERLAPEMKLQSEVFADLPEVTGAITLLWYQRWQELSQASA